MKRFVFCSALMAGSVWAQGLKPYDKENDPYVKEGNPAPEMKPVPAEVEKEILKGVEVAEGFELSLFAAPPAMNYPVFVAAAPNGDLYVACDGNGAQGRAPGRGRVVRLRDTDGDGRADETVEFVKNLDAPRGLLWDHDRLYVMHPPHLTAFIDKDGDGVAEESQRLVSDLAFDYKGRPADHTTNGLSIGVDGWLYIAGGDFAFMNAKGADGRELQHRNGGVIRVRPDGTGLEIYATGTRNILEVAISPEMEMFTRDNTNDGGGWNVRFHHFPGLTDHGYPRLYKNFNEEVWQPIVDYGGGSGCGAVYIDEPGFGEWNDAPFTADWGKGALFRHELKPKGATYVEKEDPQPFIKLYRPTDADVDAMSRVYLASWKGATFNWNGPDVGFIVQVKPKGYEPEKLPDFAKNSLQELVALCESESYRRRIEAQRELIRRGLPDEAVAGLTALAANPEKALDARATALFAFTHFPEKGKELSQKIKQLAPSPAFDVLVARAMAECADWVAEKNEGSFEIPAHWQNQPATLIQLNRLVSNTEKFNAATRREIFGITLGFSDERVRHTAVLALAKLGDDQLALEMVKSGKAVTGHKGSVLLELTALRALQKMHREEVVDGLIQLLGELKNEEVRHGILGALARLHFHEGEWKGDSWGTRPDTRGPYYQPEPWAATEKVSAALKKLIAEGEADEVSFLISEMTRNRIQSQEALHRVLALAQEDESMIPEAVSQLAGAESVPATGVPLLIKAAQTNPKGMAPTVAGPLLANAVVALAKTDSSEGAIAALHALDVVRSVDGARKEREAASEAFFKSPKLENYFDALEKEAAKTEGIVSRYADMALLTLSEKKDGSVESRELSKKALEEGWADEKRRIQILQAVAELKLHSYADKIWEATEDPSEGVVKAAKNAVKRLGLKPKDAPKAPLIGTMKTQEAMAQALKMKGDANLGESVYARAACATCHTTKESEKPKGPYLGNIAQTYDRKALAEAILEPNKTISQGFKTNVITTKKGETQMGFVTAESAEKVTIRNVAGQDFTFATADITSRETPEISIMPTGLLNAMTVEELASLLAYLEKLAKE
ncbi:MAG: DUF7133 domain-containing protein [Verrucomicrobiales bacterium]